MKRGETVEILRDRWGVPHIYAETEAGALFGQGYAMAEDRLPTMLRCYRKATGRMAEVFGAEWIEHDALVHQHRHDDCARRHYASLPPAIREATDAFAAGIKRFMAEHPERVPEWALAVEPYHSVAMTRWVIWEFIVAKQMLNQLDDLSKQPVTPRGEENGSNAWAVGPRRSASGHVLFHIDPHVEWREEWLWHESHLHGGELHSYGFNHPGKMYHILGHNEQVAWTLTMGAPATADVYELTLHPEQPLKYLYEGEWCDLQVETYSFRVKTDDGYETITRERLSSQHGIIHEVRGHRAYAFKDAYGDILDGPQVWGAIGKAQNLGAFIEAIRPCEINPINLHYADVHGNIYYVRAGRVPVRPADLDRTLPLAGDTAATDWQGIRPFSDLAQVLNPACGWYQNCNTSPAQMFPNSPLHGDNYPNDLLHGRKNDMYMQFERQASHRGLRAYERLQELDQMTLEQAEALAHDDFMTGADVWIQALTTAYTKNASAWPHLAEAITQLQSWDGHATRTSTGMSVWMMFFRAMKNGGDPDYALWNALLRGEAPTSATEEQLLRWLEAGVAHLTTHFGRLDVPWGELFHMKRGEERWPVDGGEMLPLRIVSGLLPEEDGSGRFYASFGQTCPALVHLEPGNVHSWSALTYGISEHPDSPHFADQGRELFAQGKLKDTWFGRARLEREGAITRRVVLYLDHAELD